MSSNERRAKAVYNILYPQYSRRANDTIATRRFARACKGFALLRITRVIFASENTTREIMELL